MTKTNYIDLTPFPALENFAASAYTFLPDCIDTEDSLLQCRLNGANLAALRLERIQLSFSPESQHAEFTSDFVTTQAKQLKALVEGCLNAQKMAMQEDPYRENVAPAPALKFLHIIFNPDIRYHSFEEEEREAQRWPWSYLEDAREMLKELGVQMSWNEPEVDREDWKDLVKTAKRERREREDPKGCGKIEGWFEFAEVRSSERRMLEDPNA
ncbi:MAG: hypothetical protein Q9227_007737 [Pyrenula ochraceoflavens]